MNKNSINDIVSKTLGRTYVRAIFSVAILVAVSTFFIWVLLIRPGYKSLSITKDEVKDVLAERNTKLFVSEAEQSVSNINTLFRATEGAIYAISSDILSFRDNAAVSSRPLPLIKEFLSKGAYAKFVQVNSRHGGTVSYDFPGIYCPDLACYSRTNPELIFLERYWPHFFSISKRVYEFGPEMQWIYIASESGQITMYPGLPNIPSGYDPRTRPWYQKALQTQGLVWSIPYFAAGGSDLVVTVSQKINGVNGLSNAVIAIDMNVESLISNRLALPYTNAFRLILASDNGEVIAERNMAKKGNWKREPTPIKLNNVLLASLIGIDSRMVTDKLCKHDERVSFIESNHYFFSLPIGFLNWRLIGRGDADSLFPNIIGDWEYIAGKRTR